ncbi:MAG: hypothetical protein OXG04_13455 [Acidobacteria bacterium]|nr:hypothetical protein [Acidobacteriota bacterium]
MTHQKLQVPPCPRRASGHGWSLAPERSTREYEADVYQACGLVRMNWAVNGARSGVNELPSVALTTTFLALCEQHGSEQLAVSIVAAGRSTGLQGMPQSNDWTAWNADEMRAAVEHLRRKLGR